MHKCCNLSPDVYDLNYQMCWKLDFFISQEQSHLKGIVHLKLTFCHHSPSIHYSSIIPNNESQWGPNFVHLDLLEPFLFIFFYYFYTLHHLLVSILWWMATSIKVQYTMLEYQPDVTDAGLLIILFLVYFTYRQFQYIVTPLLSLYGQDILKHLHLCSTEEIKLYRFGTTWG